MFVTVFFVGKNLKLLTRLDACIGFNSLYNVQAASDGHPCAPLKNSSKPNGERIWQWLVHTDDGESQKLRHEQRETKS